MSQDKEIEVRVRIENSENLFLFLQEKAEFTGEKHQTDKYFVPAHKNFTEVRPVKEWLRLRDSSGKYSVNYKNWHFDEDGKSHYCDEYETPVENIEQMEKILAALDMKKIVVVEKVRKTYMYQNYEIAIDMVTGLGDYVEIEYKGEVKDQKPAEVANGMIEFLKKIDCGKIQRDYVGYPFQILFPSEIVSEEQ
jgi:adenylate cyclase class 2